MQGTNLHAVVMKICHDPPTPVSDEWGDDLPKLLTKMLDVQALPL